MGRKMTKYLKYAIQHRQWQTKSLNDAVARMEAIEAGFLVQQQKLEELLLQNDLDGMKETLSQMASLAENAELILQQVVT